jgi:quinohemoprotein ethanol dehydrogenase
MKDLFSIGKFFTLLALMTLSSCAPLANQLDSEDWQVYGGSNDENHYSNLTDITADNVSKLRLAWYADLDSPWSASAPVEAEGVLYTATGLSIVQAFDVVTGRQLWSYDPKVSETTDKVRLQAPHWGIRGLAFADGRLHVATLDGRLIALKASNGSLVWEKQTLDPKTPSSYITGVPRVFDGKVIIGFAGADVGTTRGTEGSSRRDWRAPTNGAGGCFLRAADRR